MYIKKSIIHTLDINIFFSDGIFTTLIYYQLKALKNKFTHTHTLI